MNKKNMKGNLWNKRSSRAMKRFANQVSGISNEINKENDKKNGMKMITIGGQLDRNLDVKSLLKSSDIMKDSKKEANMNEKKQQLMNICDVNASNLPTLKRARSINNIIPKKRKRTNLNQNNETININNIDNSILRDIHVNKQVNPSKRMKFNPSSNVLVKSHSMNYGKGINRNHSIISHQRRDQGWINRLQNSQNYNKSSFTQAEKLEFGSLKRSLSEGHLSITDLELIQDTKEDGENGKYKNGFGTRNRNGAAPFRRGKYQNCKYKGFRFKKKKGYKNNKYNNYNNRSNKYIDWKDKKVFSPWTIFDNAIEHFNEHFDELKQLINHNIDVNNLENIKEDDLLNSLNTVFGYHSFRSGQLWTINKALNYERTLTILPTGSGKSLCYQLPALYFPGIVLVLSPLISLINDQISNLPNELSACSFSNIRNINSMKDMIQKIIEGKIKIIFLSPERFLSPQFINNFLPLLNKYNVQISSLVIDEAHCISQWSHNFRPSFLRVGLLLPKLVTLNQNKLSVIALTATASEMVKHEICNILKMNDEDNNLDDIEDSNNENLYSEGWYRNNLYPNIFEVNGEVDKINCLLHILKPKSNKLNDIKKIIGSKNKTSYSLKSGGVIIYVRKKKTTERIVELLRSKNILAYPFHADLPTSEKKKVYKYFMKNNKKESKNDKNNLKVVVATIAFGLGINKADIRGVIHYDLPSTLENYVQEIGRAGRDNEPANIYIFFDRSGDESLELNSLLNANIVSKQQISKFINYIFTNDINEDNYLKHLSDIIPLSYIKNELNLTFSMADTLIAILEIYFYHNENENKSNTMLRLKSYGRIYCKAEIIFRKEKLENLRNVNIIFDIIYNKGLKIDPANALSKQGERNKANYDKGIWVIKFDSLMNELNISYDLLLKELKELDKKGYIWVNAFEEGLLVEKKYKDNLFYLIDDSKRNEFINVLYEKTQFQENQQIKRNGAVYNLFLYLFDTFMNENEENKNNDNDDDDDDDYENENEDETENKTLQSEWYKMIDEYFSATSINEDYELMNRKLPFHEIDFNRKIEIADDAENLLYHPSFNNLEDDLLNDVEYCSLAITKIFNGLTSNNFSYDEWVKTPYFGKYKMFDFNIIMGIVEKIVLLKKSKI